MVTALISEYVLFSFFFKAFIADETAKERLRESYELMLDFYGMKLVNYQTGEVERAENWRERFYNLNKLVE